MMFFSRARSVLSLSLIAGVAGVLVVACGSPEGSLPDSDGSLPDDEIGSDGGAPPDAAIVEGDGAVDGSIADDPAVCGADAKSGGYCGNDQIDNGDPDTLYTCDGPGEPTASMACPSGCVVAPAGQADYCMVPASAKGYRLPWGHATSMKLTQDCNDSCCSDHVGSDKYAWDFANGGGFTVRAARAGTITHFKINSTKGCATTACSTYVNMIVIDHGDGTQATYMHLEGASAEPGITCGAHVDQGQALATAGTTGHSTGVHLHFQVSKVHTGAPKCECGTDGKQCATNTNLYPNMWVSSTYPTLPIDFEEWPSASCSNRRLTLPAALD